MMAAPSAAQDETECELLTRADVGRLGLLVERLGRRVEDLEQEAAALKGCLEEDGIISSERFMARLHQARFQMALRKHPCHCDASLSDILLVKELRSALGSFLAWSVVRRCATLGRCTKELLFTIPHMVYVCGGFDGTQILASMQRFDPKTWCPWLFDDKVVQPVSQTDDDDSREDCFFMCGSRRGTERTEGMARLGLGQISMGSGQQLSPMSRCRAGFAAGVCADTFLVCGGFDGKSFLSSVERFRFSVADPMDVNAEGLGNWEEVAPMRQRRHCAVAAALLGKLYVCGGYNGEDVLKCTERFDPCVGEWEYSAPMLYSRHGAAAAVLKGCLYVCGGMNEDETLNTVECLEPVTGEWKMVAPMREQRNGAVAAVLDGQLYVCGGTNGIETLRSVECFDPVQNTWIEAPPLIQRRHGAASTSALGQIFIYGGADSTVESPTSGQPLDEVESFSPGLRAWRRLAPLSAPRLDMAVVSMYSLA